MGTAISCVPSKGFPIEVVVMSLGVSRFKKCRNALSAAHHLRKAFFPTQGQRVYPKKSPPKNSHYYPVVLLLALYSKETK
jgi:hypothetical protein